jgi:hypothetical protein
MIKMSAGTLLISFGVVAMLPGCAGTGMGLPGMPTASGGGGDSCSVDHAAVDAAIGGGAFGLTTAIVTHGNFLDTALATVVGAGAGYFIGNRTDQQCQQEAMEAALQQADVYAQNKPVPVETAAQAQGPTYRKIHGHYRKVPAKPQAEYQAVAWKSQNGDTGSIQPVKTYKDASTGDLCSTFRNTAMTTDGASEQTQVACKVNGKWQVASSTSTT